MQLAKYIILLWQGNEQAVAFPENVKHDHVYDYIRRENPAIRAVSAGFFSDAGDALWHGGASDTLGLSSRPTDAQHIHKMLKSEDRRHWDLRVLVWEACESSRRSDPAMQSPDISFG